MFPVGWLKKHTITIDHTKVAATASNFTILLSDSNFLTDCYNNTQSAGQDLRFTTDASGATQIPFEVVFWNTAGTAEVYVKIPSLSSSVDTVIYVWYGNPTAPALADNDTYGAQNAWDANFKAVHHMNGASETALDDSTANNVDITSKSGTPTFNQAGKWGKAVAFGNNSSVYLSGYNYTGSNVTVTVVIKLAGDTDTDGVISIARANSHGFAMYPNGTNTAAWSINTTYGPSISNTPGAGTWFFLNGIYNGTNARIYKNAVFDSEAAGAAPASDASCDFIIGALTTTTSYFNGSIEEVRYSNTDRGDNWLTTEYNNLNSPSTFSTPSGATWGSTTTSTTTSTTSSTSTSTSTSSSTSSSSTSTSSTTSARTTLTTSSTTTSTSTSTSTTTSTTSSSTTTFAPFIRSTGYIIKETFYGETLSIV